MFGRSKFDFSFILDSELNIVESDRTTIRVFGLPSDTKLHKLWSFLSVCNTSEKVYEVLCKQSTISDFTKRAGEIQLQFLPVLDNFVKYSVRGIIKDIKFASGTVDQSTDTERNDDEFILNGARFDAIVNSMNCGLIIEDDQRKIVLANSQFCKMFYIPVPPHYLNGGNCSEALKQSSHLFKYPELVIDQVLQLLDEKIEKLGDEVYMSDGKIMERDYIPIYINQNYKGHLWVYRDITSIKMVSTKESVNTISQLLLSVGSTQQIYTKIPRIISERFNFPIVSINLYNSHDNRITPVGSIGFPEVESTPKFGLNESFDCHGTVFGHCVTMGTSVYYPPVLDENLILPVPGVEKIENYICLPLKGENSQIGCLFLANNARHYHSDEILINTANLIASAIEREMNKLELITARDQALESVKLKSQFVANISHELRTPLNSVIGMCDIILSTKLDSDQQSCAETIKMSSNILLTVINEILNFSKLEAGKIEITIDDFDIRETVEGVTAMLWGVAKERDIMMNCFVPVNFPSWGRCDSVKVSEILVNLIGNAIKFTHSGYVYVRVFQVESNIRIEVRDTGIGIDSSSMGLLYRPFTQVDGSRTRRHTGTGLGLCISKQMVEMLGGNIGVESKKGCGSTFWVEFPWKQAVTMAPDRILIPESFPIKEFVNLSAVIITSNVTLKEWTSELCKELGIKINFWEDQFPTENMNDYIDRSLKLLKVDFIFVDNQLITNPLLYWNVKFGILTKSHTQSNTLIHQSPHGFIETPFKLRKIIETIKNLIDSTSNAPTRSISLKINNESEKYAFGNYRVLIVEDNLMNIKMLVRLLNKEGISNIDVAEDGEKGVAFCSQNDYDLVFMDCHMPILDGFEASKMIRNKEFEKKSNRSVPIVAATANVMPSDIELCYRSGMDDFVAKPITAESVRTVLKKFLL